MTFWELVNLISFFLFVLSAIVCNWGNLNYWKVMISMILISVLSCYFLRKIWPS